MVIIGYAPTLATASEYEKIWTKLAREAGLPLVNYKDAYDYTGPRPVSWGERISKAKLGKPRRPHSPEAIEKVASWHRGRYRSAESKKRMVDAQKRNHKNLEKLIERNRTFKFAYTPERRKMMSDIMKKIRAEHYWSTRKSESGR